MGKSLRTRRSSTEVRELILAAAGEAFGRHGYAVTTMDDIALSAGVARPLLFRHFGSKSELFRASQLQPFLDLLSNFRSTWESQFDELWDERRVMRTMVAAVYDSFRSHRAGMLAIAASTDPELVKATRAALDEVFADVNKIGANEALRRGWFSERNLELTIRMIVGTVASMSVLDNLLLPGGRRRPGRDQILDHLTSLVLYGLRLEPCESMRPS